MPWVRVDDQYPEHPKITAAGHLAGWLDVCAMAYCNRALTDGFVAAAMVPRLSSVPQPMKRAAELVAAGRWEETAGGYLIHDYLEYQKTKAQIERERSQAADRKATERKRRRAEAESTAGHAPSHAVTHGRITSAPLPLPNRTSQDYSNAVVGATGHGVTPAPVEAIRSQVKGSPDGPALARRALRPVPDEPNPATGDDVTHGSPGTRTVGAEA